MEDLTRILVTGGAGFIGTGLLRRLLQEQTEKRLEIRALDVRPNRVGGYTSIQGDILDVPVLEQAMKDCDIVVHLAAFLGVRLSDRDRLKCLETNITGTRNVLDACLANDVRKLIFTSSSEVYGENGTEPFSETSPLCPKSVYAVSKLAGEEYIQAYATRYGFDYSILRPFNVYGPDQSEEFVIPRFVRAAIEGRPPQVYGSGQQVRAFCSVDDFVEGLTLALFSPEANGEVINLGNDTEGITILELGRKIVALSDNRGPIPELVPYEKADRTSERDVNWRVPYLQKAKRILGYTPKIDLDDGIFRFFESLKSTRVSGFPRP